jgi:cell division septal protein FtsQ
MKKPSSNKQYWYELQQDTIKKSSPVARRRTVLRWLRNIGITAFACLLIGALGYVVFYSPSQVSSNMGNQSEQKVSRVLFTSDGVLNEIWFERTFGALTNKNVMDIDVRNLKDRLELVGQIREASVSRDMPDRLIVEVRECQPVLKARYLSQGMHKSLLVSREGRIYEGVLYPSKTLKYLPYLAGVKLQMSSEGFKPIEGMEDVSDLIRSLRDQSSDFYRTITAVDLSHYETREKVPGSFIRMLSRNYGEVIFGHKQISEQIVRLQQILAYQKENEVRAIRKIDLSFPAQAVVQYDEHSTIK